MSKVEKIEIPDEVYEEDRDFIVDCPDSLRSFRKKQHAGCFNEEETAKKEAELAACDAEEAAAIAVGNHCQVVVVGLPTTIGTVMYVGTVDFKPGHWVGVKYASWET
ncbi:hypothetical protein J4Q44_G00331510 [Coregonus suidteri]|uniref:CAP-Gly domain-containing protein n=1 Tax=Coregonus suidteri TaxID=861788 RepID=A0AAN8KLG6_9TELE